MKGIIKPAGLKKPNMKRGPVSEPPKVEKEKVETVNLDEIIEDIVEEEVIEESVVKEEPVVEEVIEDIPMESSAPESEEELQKRLDEAAEKEAVQETEEPVAEEVVEEVVEEAPKKKSSSRKRSSNKKKEIKEEVAQEPINREDYKAKPLVDAMKSMIGITGCTTPEWEQTKANIIEQVEGMHIDPDSTPAEMRYLIADIDAALSQLKIYKINADQQFNPLLKHINYVSLQAGSKGANSEERKANAIRGLIEYKTNPDDTEYTNLLDIQVFAENQIAFYDEMIKILVDKKNMLITFSGIVKTETQLGGC